MRFKQNPAQYSRDIPSESEYLIDPSFWGDSDRTEDREQYSRYRSIIGKFERGYGSKSQVEKQLGWLFKKQVGNIDARRIADFWDYKGTPCGKFKRHGLIQILIELGYRAIDMDGEKILIRLLEGERVPVELSTWENAKHDLTHIGYYGYPPGVERIEFNWWLKKHLPHKMPMFLNNHLSSHDIPLDRNWIKVIRVIANDGIEIFRNDKKIALLDKLRDNFIEVNGFTKVKDYKWPWPGPCEPKKDWPFYYKHIWEDYYLILNGGDRKNYPPYKVPIHWLDSAIVRYPSEGDIGQIVPKNLKNQKASHENDDNNWIVSNFCLNRSNSFESPFHASINWIKEKVQRDYQGDPTAINNALDRMLLNMPESDMILAEFLNKV